ncbi:MAG: hypothetical protein QXZ06_07000 [Candidatus Jordarchaeales archaeon]
MALQDLAFLAEHYPESLDTKLIQAFLDQFLSHGSITLDDRRLSRRVRQRLKRELKLKEKQARRWRQYGLIRLERLRAERLRRRYELMYLLLLSVYRSLISMDEARVRVKVFPRFWYVSRDEYRFYSAPEFLLEDFKDSPGLVVLAFQKPPESS